jgi:hypothetical protein
MGVDTRAILESLLRPLGFTSVVVQFKERAGPPARRRASPFAGSRTGPCARRASRRARSWRERAAPGLFPPRWPARGACPGSLCRGPVRATLGGARCSPGGARRPLVDLEHAHVLVADSDHLPPLGDEAPPRSDAPGPRRPSPRAVPRTCAGSSAGPRSADDAGRRPHVGVATLRRRGGRRGLRRPSRRWPARFR